MSKYMADFETTVNNPEETQVWAAGIISLDRDPSTLRIFDNLSEWMEYVFHLKPDIVYFHNLKFDGSFILNWLNKWTFKQAWNEQDGFKNVKYLSENEYTVSITAMGQWYSIHFRKYGHTTELRDSAKLLPFSVDQIAKSFGTAVKKGSIDYSAHNNPGEPISDEEMEYLKNDLEVPAEALEYMAEQGHSKLTIGSCCLTEFRRDFQPKSYWDEIFPDPYERVMPYHYTTYGEFINKFYRGGYCYVAEQIRGKILHNGYTLDVNSLYPSVMESGSGNLYPVGNGYLDTGIKNMYDKKLAIPKHRGDPIAFVECNASFHLKNGYLPTIQIKGDWRFKSNEYLKNNYVYGKNGDVISKNPVRLYLTAMDLELFQKHYHIDHFEILRVVVYDTDLGMFDNYIHKYFAGKQNAKTKMERTLNKLFLNNLYGKLATNKNSSYKTVYFDDNVLKFKTIEEYDKHTVYIPAGVCVTSYARYFTITHGQKNYEHLCYIDTDSLHLTGTPSDAVGIDIHESDLRKWKVENVWKHAIFAKQKTYIEINDWDDILIKCAGMGKEPKRRIREMLEMGYMRLDEFRPGFKVGGNLRSKQVKGGCILLDSDFVML